MGSIKEKENLHFNLLITVASQLHIWNLTRQYAQFNPMVKIDGGIGSAQNRATNLYDTSR